MYLHVVLLALVNSVFKLLLMRQRWPLLLLAHLLTSLSHFLTCCLRAFFGKVQRSTCANASLLLAARPPSLSPYMKVYTFP